MVCSRLAVHVTMSCARSSLFAVGDYVIFGDRTMFPMSWTTGWSPKLLFLLGCDRVILAVMS